MPEILQPPVQIPEIKGMSPEFRQFLSSSPQSLEEFLALSSERQVEVAVGFLNLAKVLPREHDRFRKLVDVQKQTPVLKARGAHA